MALMTIKEFIQSLLACHIFFFHEEMSFSTHKWPPYNKGMMLGISRHIVTSSNLYLSAVMVANIFCQLNVFNSIYCSCDIKPLFEGTFSFVLTKMIQLNELCTMQVFLWLELGGHREHHILLLSIHIKVWFQNWLSSFVFIEMRSQFMMTHTTRNS